MSREKITIGRIMENKAKGLKMSRTALYDYPMAVLAEAAGLEIINVGDSIASVMLGYENTLPAQLDLMVEHAKAVRRGAPTAFIMGDMPFLSYQISIEQAIANAGRYIKEAGMDCVKVEGGLEIVPIIEALTKASIPVIGHTGLTPQSAVMLGGYKAAGSSAEVACQLVKTVEAFDRAGCVAVTVEAVPVEVAKVLYARCSAPMFGTGTGQYTDAPFINIYDLLGFFEKVPRFAKTYANFRQEAVEAITAFKREITEGLYPTPANSYHMKEGEEAKFFKMLENQA
ncbi:3-methyl-2-oxobutanoate hydroxymethyltransferase [Deltaproteobacteria bacterium]|nr:3-methyl-2-oxobutanoate hydroxymethyltransferase [Deltaproteobacteria bacterium]